MSFIKFRRNQPSFPFNFVDMKYLYLLFIVAFSLLSCQVHSQVRLIILNQYNLKKRDTLKANLSSHVHLTTESNLRSTTTISTDIHLFQRSKKITLNPFISKDYTFLKYKPELMGSLVLEISQRILSECSKEEYLANLQDQGLISIAKQMESILNGNNPVKDSAVFYTKSLIFLEKNKSFSKHPITNDHEITLINNPFGASYGDQIVALLTLNGKPKPHAPVLLYVMTKSGNITTEQLSSDADGMLNIKLGIEGVYFLQHLFIAKVSTNNEVNSLWSTFSFEFLNTEHKRNTYAEFGF